VDTKGNPLPIFQANGQPTVVQFNSLPGYRFASFPRQTDFSHDDYRVILGGRGDINDAWSYDVYGSYWYTQDQNKALNNISFTRLQDSVSGCASGFSNCVPVDLFKLGGLTQAAVSYLSLPGILAANLREMSADANITGDLGVYGLKSPFAREGLAFAGGLEYRRVENAILPDAEYQAGDLLGQGGNVLPQAGQETFKEVYGEMRIPVAAGMTFIDSFNIDAAIRHQETSIGNTTQTFSDNTFKLSTDYAPTQDVRFRGGFNRAARAPNLSELFAPVTGATAAVSGGDPCSGATPAQSLAACAASGVTAASYGKIPNCVSNQCQQYSGGNVGLKPEKADTWTWGMNFTPSFLPNFNMSVDYWDVKVNNYITSNSASGIINGCILNQIQALCAFIHRNPLTGDLGSVAQGYVLASLQNFGFLHNRGIDFEANYKENLDDVGLKNWGLVNVKFDGTYGLQAQISGLTDYNCQGLYGAICSQNGATGPRFDWRHDVSVTWTTPMDLDLNFKWRYMSSTALDTNSAQTALNNKSFDSVDAKIPAYNYFDVSAAYKLFGNYTIRAGVNNIMDKDPPVLSQTAVPTAAATNGNTYSGVYDVLGRTFFMSFNAKM
jgi:outer membrane receptor protein involved in Fe transport